MNSKPYRPCVGIMLINRDGRAFVGRRVDVFEEAWQMPQGGIDEGEPPRDAALRELHEEAGTDKAVIVAETKDWLTYDLPEPTAATRWGGKWRGQTMKWFALRFTGSDADIDLDAHQPAEFNEWRWHRIESLPDLVVPFKRPIYHAVVKEFAPVAKKIAAGEKR
jgi:putative (di)nucleoside polyphosphate hydrolase